jgi:hypothetical protein
MQNVNVRPNLEIFGNTQQHGMEPRKITPKKTL